MPRSLPLLGLLVLGCVSTAPRAGSTAKPVEITAEMVDPARAARGDKLICAMERPTGSHLPEQVCRWASDKEAISEEARDALRFRPIQPRAE